MNMADLRDRLRAAALSESDAVEVMAFPDYICLRILEEKRHFWSPRLNLSMSEINGEKTHVEGVYGPNGNVWALYVYGYLILGKLALFSAIFGFVQLWLHSYPWGLWIFAGSILAAVAMYLAAQFGQKLAMMQTFLLHQTYEKATGEHVEIH